MVEMCSMKKPIAPMLLGLLAAVGLESPVYGQALTLAATNGSLCFWSDTDNDQSSPVPYNPANLDCVENTGLNDLNVFRVVSATSGNGTSAVVFDIDAGIAVDANPFSSEYQAGRISYSYTLSISGTGGAPWDLTVDQQMQGLLATDSDGTGSANASSSAVTSGLSISPLPAGSALSFGSLVTRSSFAFGSTPFSASRSGDLVQGVGDTVLAGSIEITLDAFSEWGGLFGLALDGAVLFGIDDVSQSGFVTVDEYATWGRAVGPDGYQANFSLALTGPVCGDGTTDPGEECDDGGTVDEDGCSSNCVVEFCGDSIRQAGLGEQCDDGNNTDGDGCSATCLTEVVVVPALSSRGIVVLAGALVGLALLTTLLPKRRRAPASRPGSPGR
jgi:cysteine-rich repeat protein